MLPGSSEDLRRVVVSITSATTTALLAAIAGKKIRLVSFFVMNSAAQSITFKSDANALSGAIPLAAGDGFVLPSDLVGWLETNTGEALNLTTSATSNLMGVATLLVATP